MNPEQLSHQNKNTLRQYLRQKRRHLSKMKQHQHAQAISHRIIHSKMYRHSRSIALYLSADGEVDLSPLVNKLHAHYKQCYLPVILSRRQALMAFAPYKKNTRLKKNCFGVLEPHYRKKQLKSARQLDMILAPLVGFDDHGNRMGMGGGFYDRALQHLKGSNPSRKRKHPLFIGIAHEIQNVPRLDSQIWDIPMHAIITERRFKFF